jgi:hypothetical protein
VRSLQKLAGVVGVADRGRFVDAEHRGQVQRIGAVGEGLFDLSVEAEPACVHAPYRRRLYYSAKLSRWFVTCEMSGDAEGPAIPLAGGYRRNASPRPGKTPRPVVAGGGSSNRLSPAALTSGNQRIRLDARHRAKRRCTPPRAAIQATAGHPAHQGLTRCLVTARGTPAATGHEHDIRSREGRA